ncbi:MAG: hypothetical protein IKO89_10175 [Bacteroidales bacterium]|nr:hypothetical protein [Bacteroidales bacterium]MBR4488911.1 hypothetical protein [Bacteroidales bacterium]
MATLQAYLSGILNEISEARRASDYKSVQIAEGYLKDKILKGYSVPRMRIGNVEIDAPVAIDSIEETNLINDNVDINVTTDEVYENLCEEFSLTQTDISTLKSSGVEATIKGQISTNLANLFVSEAGESTTKDDTADVINKISACASLIVTNFKNSVEKSITLTSTVSVDDVSQNLTTLLCDVFIAKDLTEIKIVAEASKLKDMSEKSIFHIKMNIIEDGMEWSISQNPKGEVEAKLIPE